ncbi:MAG: protein-glutamate O-methyltransferase family protein [Methylacidiphilales bacterium]|nr:protein-glutamate O-methyltransferase family protein [Candidatus Methylacidiphilales bacterium]
MRIYKGFLDAIRDEKIFIEEFKKYAGEVFGACRLYPVISDARLIEVRGAWLHDLKHVGKHEPNLTDGLDHFKQCGHLSFWIRRLSPVVEATDSKSDLGDAEGYDLSTIEIGLRDTLFGYANEYLAFDYCFIICKYYEANKKGSPSEFARDLTISPDYYKVIRQFLKYKSVSPHAMHLIYRSLFMH